MRPPTHSCRTRQVKLKTLCFSSTFVVGLFLSTLTPGQKPDPTIVIPKTWDTEAINSFQLPLADRKLSTKLISSSYYYSIPVRPIYKSYDVYRPDREPPGYIQ